MKKKNVSICRLYPIHHGRRISFMEFHKLDEPIVNNASWVFSYTFYMRAVVGGADSSCLSPVITNFVVRRLCDFSCLSFDLSLGRTFQRRACQVLYAYHNVSLNAYNEAAVSWRQQTGRTKGACRALKLLLSLQSLSALLRLAAASGQKKATHSYSKILF